MTSFRGSQLVLIIGPPRGGTTLLLRLLAAHSRIYGRPEPHLVPPLAHLGYYATVDAAPFDHLQAARALHAFVADLPRGEADYLEACRAYLDVLYGRMLAARGSGKELLVDKTPANALVLPFLCRVYPDARYVVITRNPAAVFHSYATAFFDGDYEAARRFNPILDRYVPAIARFMREGAVPTVAVRYERLVEAPEAELQRVCAFLGVPFEPSMVEYGRHGFAPGGLGDPVTVGRHPRPVREPRDRWARELAADPGKLAWMRALLDGLEDADLETWGYPRQTLLGPVEDARNGTGAGHAPVRPPLDRFRLERKALRLARGLVHRHGWIGRGIRGLRTLCDLLLRG